MKKLVAFFLYLYGMLLFLPVLFTVFLSGGNIFNHYRSCEERYLPLLLSTEISAEVPEEVLKAQAVLTRTNYRVAQADGTSKEEMYRVLTQYYDIKNAPWKLLENYSAYQSAVNAAGEIMTYNSRPCWTPYHRVSSGFTRDGQEVLHDLSYAYLVSVDSQQDLKAPTYAHSYYFPEDFQKNISVIASDSAGYVTEVQADQELLSGEEVRRQMELPSSAFSFQNVDGQLRVLCKGEGHGLGLSQYGAQVLAEEGKTYIEILSYYFPLMEIKGST